MIKKFCAFIICSVAMLLPYKLRCLYTEFIGWTVQGLYFLYFSLLKFVVGQLRKAVKKERPVE